MKKIITFLLAFTLVFAIALPVLALDDEAPIEIIVHYQYENKTDDPDMDLGLFTIGATIVLKDLGGGLINVEYGWSQFDGPFATDDFGYILSFTAGYKETDVSEFVIRSANWSELSVIKIPINTHVDSKIELWAVAQDGNTEAVVTTSAPGAAAPAEPEPVVEEATPVVEEPALVAEEPAPVVEEPAPVAEAAPAPVSPKTGDNNIILLAFGALFISFGSLLVLKKKKATGM